MKISASQITTFHDCPLQWKFSYLDKLEPDEKFTYMNTIFGTAFHYIMECIFSDENDSLSIELPMDELVKKSKVVFKEKFIEEYNNYQAKGFNVKSSARSSFKDEMNDMVYRVQINLIKLLKSEFYKDYDSIKTEEVLNITTNDFVIKGIIDFIGLREDGSFDIMDFKTGSFFEAKEISKDYQTLFYVFMSYDRFGNFPDSFKYLLSNRKQMSFDIHEVTGFDLNTIGHFYRCIDEFKTLVDAGDFKKKDPKQRNILCNFCQYKKKCEST